MKKQMAMKKQIAVCRMAYYCYPAFYQCLTDVKEKMYTSSKQAGPDQKWKGKNAIILYLVTAFK